MADVVVSRKFRLTDLNLAQEFDEFRDTVNDQTQQGLQLPYSTFDNKSLIAVKKFYKLLNNPVNGIKERAHRCAAQYSYFNLKKYREDQKYLLEITDTMLNNGFFSNIHSSLNTDLKYYEIDNKINFIHNLVLNSQSIDLNIFHTNHPEELKYRKSLTRK